MLLSRCPSRTRRSSALPYSAAASPYCPDKNMALPASFNASTAAGTSFSGTAAAGLDGKVGVGVKEARGGVSVWPAGADSVGADDNEFSASAASSLLSSLSSSTTMRLGVATGLLARSGLEALGLVTDDSAEGALDEESVPADAEDSSPTSSSSSLLSSLSSSIVTRLIDLSSFGRFAFSCLAVSMASL